MDETRLWRLLGFPVGEVAWVVETPWPSNRIWWDGIGGIRCEKLTLAGFSASQAVSRQPAPTAMAKPQAGPFWSFACQGNVYGLGLTCLQLLGSRASFVPVGRNPSHPETDEDLLHPVTSSLLAS